MIYICAAVFGIFTGLLLKGRLINILNFKINKAWLLIAAFIVQSSSQILALKGFGFTVKHSLVISTMVFLMLFTVLWLNRKYIGINVVGLGCLLNALVMLANGGKMPVSKELLINENLLNIIDIYKTGGDGKHILAEGTARLTFLGDMIRIPDAFGNIAKFISIGDAFVVLGLSVLMAEIVKGKENQSRNNACSIDKV